MPTNRLSKILGISTFGESHGKAIGILIDSPLPNLPIPEQAILEAVSRRKPSTPFETTRREPDEIEFLSGVLEGRTTGTPLCIIIRNQDPRPEDYAPMKDVFRPGHADFAWFAKYGIYDYRGGGRASGRETVARIIAASLNESMLGKINVHCETIRIGDLTTPAEAATTPNNVYRWTGDPHQLHAYLDTIKEQGDSVGGIVRVTISGAPSGLGDPVFEKLSANLAKAMLSIGSVKGILFGDGLALASRKGSEVNDQMNSQGWCSNHVGGINGGISNGNDIVFDVIIRPVSSISIPQSTIDKAGNEHRLSLQGRFDTCHIPRIIPVIEAMTKLTLCDAIQYQNLVSPTHPNIPALREALDKLDEELIDMLYRRKALVSKVKALKDAKGIPFLDPQREQDIITRIQYLAAASDLDPELVSNIMKTVLEVCKC